MAKEIERKFLVAGGEWRNEVTHSMAFRQAYVASMENRSVRVRIVDQRDATLTIKIGASALVRDEYEYSIPLKDAEELMASAPGVVIEKPATPSIMAASPGKWMFSKGNITGWWWRKWK